MITTFPNLPCLYESSTPSKGKDWKKKERKQSLAEKMIDIKKGKWNGWKEKWMELGIEWSLTSDRVKAIIAF